MLHAIKHYLLFFILFCGALTTAAAQSALEGTVRNATGEPLVGATLHWKGSPGGTTTDSDGAFRLPREAGRDTLLVSFVGYQTFALPIPPVLTTTDIVLQEGTTLSEVEVAARQTGNYTSVIETHNVESITSKELRKAPCCSLGESFETNATVDVSYNDALTGTREIQMLGLRGTYTQLLMEKRPTMTGLATPYGLDFMPGTWLESIQIGKGSSTVQTGASSLTGQINTELVKPMLDKPLFVNLFYSDMGRGEANVHLNQRFNDQWSSGLLLHGSFVDNHHDFDSDNFKDMPNRQTGEAMYRLHYQGNTIESQFNVLAVRDRRQAGQISEHDHGQAITDPYRLLQANDRVEVFGKFGYFGFAQPYKSTGLILSGAWHELDNQYGLTLHRGTQRSAYANWLYATIIGTTDHQVTLGANYQYDDFRESLGESELNRSESQVGAYGEYTYLYARPQGGRGLKSFTAILGLRLDHHNSFGLQFTPRLNLKASFSDDNALRLSIGRGWRSPNVWVENLGWLASSRDIVLADDLGLEAAWNMGLNFTQNFRLGKREGSLVIDAYRTDFQDQIIVDMEADADNLYFYQLDGRSYSNSFLTTLNYEILRRLDMKVAFKINDTRTTYRSNGLRELPLVPRYRGLVTLDYELPNRRWIINTNWQWVGSQRLPDHDIIPTTVPVAQPQVAPSYSLFNAQLTFLLNDHWQFYGGGENLGNVRQRNAIIGAYEPYGDYFDATQVYQPLAGRRFYVGLRYSLE